MGKAKDDTFCSIVDDLCLKSRAIFAKSGAIVGGFLRDEKRGYQHRAHWSGGYWHGGIGRDEWARWVEWAGSIKIALNVRSGAASALAQIRTAQSRLEENILTQKTQAALGTQARRRGKRILATDFTDNH